jgi:periplasmic divalent cation tolerance protein
MNIIFVYVTVPNMKKAKHIAFHLLKERLAACINMFPVDSLYWWENKIEKAKEIVLIIKTRKENWKKIKEEIKKIHPYTIPCIARLDVKVNKVFGNWLKKETSAN